MKGRLLTALLPAESVAIFNGAPYISCTSRFNEKVFHAANEVALYVPPSYASHFETGICISFANSRQRN